MWTHATDLRCWGREEASETGGQGQSNQGGVAHQAEGRVKEKEGGVLFPDGKPGEGRMKHSLIMSFTFMCNTVLAVNVHVNIANAEKMDGK